MLFCIFIIFILTILFFYSMFKIIDLMILKLELGVDMNVINNITELIGNTPLVKINKINKTNNNIFVKLESFNPLSSIKDRVALSIIEAAEKSGDLKKDGEIIEATSGNTGIGLAMVSAVKGYKITLVMPESMSLERRRILKILGANLVLTPAEKGMKGAIEKAIELNKENKNSILANQFKNSANPEIHKKTTALEIISDTDGKIDYLISAIGTGGTITGVGEVLKEEIKDIKIIGIEPKDSNVINNGKPGPHKIQGIGAGFIPKILNLDIVDETLEITNEEAFEMAKSLAKNEGIFAGISSGSALAGALKIAKTVKNKNIVVILPDTGERYLSMDFWD